MKLPSLNATILAKLVINKNEATCFRFEVILNNRPN